MPGQFAVSEIHAMKILSAASSRGFLIPRVGLGLRHDFAVLDHRQRRQSRAVVEIIVAHHFELVLRAPWTFGQEISWAWTWACNFPDDTPGAPSHPPAFGAPKKSK